MMNYCVYLHTSPTNKYYVGITKQNPLKRWANGRGYCKNKHFYKAILKYGWDNFKHEIVFSGITKDEAIQYEKEINKTIEDAILPDKKTYELVKGIDTAYGTDYLDAYKRIAARDMTNRGKYIKYAVGSDMQSYLLDPSESKSHMLHLKRALVNEGKIHDWSSKVNQNTIEDFLFDPRNTGVVNNANKLQYNMYRNKSRFVDRINNLTPMEFITPLLLPVAGYETNKE